MGKKKSTEGHFIAFLKEQKLGKNILRMTSGWCNSFEKYHKTWTQESEGRCILACSECYYIKKVGSDKTNFRNILKSSNFISSAILSFHGDPTGFCERGSKR